MKRVRWPQAALALSSLVVLATASAEGPRGNIKEARNQSAAADEWLSYGRTSDEQRYSPLIQIDRSSVAKLGLAWWGEFDTDRGQEGTPLVSNGVLYTTTAWSKVFAYDAKTGRQLWKYDPKVPGQTALAVCCDVVSRGLALWNGRIYIATLDGRLIALDARTGGPVWQQQTTDPAQAYTITGAPRVVRGKVIIGNAGAEYGVRGYASAYDANTGKLAWRFFMTPNPKGVPDNAASDSAFRQFAAATWRPGAWQETGGGGTPWDAITYDEVNDLLLIGTGNGSPWNRDVRSPGGGDNLFLASIVALRPETGEYVWHYQTAPGESWDYTATQPIMVADIRIDGKTRRVVMQAPKNGFFYVLDAKTGKLLSAEKYVPLDWAERVDLKTGRPIEAAYARYPQGHTARPLPGSFGAHNWQPMAFSPQTGLVYFPAHQLRGYYSQPAPGTKFTFLPGVRNYGTGSRLDRPATVAPAKTTLPADAFGELIAWDPAAGKPRWRLRFAEPWRSGVLATAGGLVFHAVGRQFTAFDAATGATLWRYDTVASAIAPPITYAIDGVQYIAILVGYGGAGGLTGGEPRRPGRLLVFRLGGTAKATPYPAIEERPPLDMAGAVPSSGDVERGAADYTRFCAACHRQNAFLPNLSRTPIILEPDGFKAVVLEGALVDQGMPSFRRYLDAGRVENLRAFFLSEATKKPASGTAEAPDHP